MTEQETERATIQRLAKAARAMLDYPEGQASLNTIRRELRAALLVVDVLLEGWGASRTADSRTIRDVNGPVRDAPDPGISHVCYIGEHERCAVMLGAFRRVRCTCVCHSEAPEGTDMWLAQRGLQLGECIAYRDGKPVAWLLQPMQGATPEDPCADALDKLWEDVILKWKPDYGDWEYPGQAYRHLLAEYDELRVLVGQLTLEKALGDTRRIPGMRYHCVDCGKGGWRTYFDYMNHDCKPAPAASGAKLSKQLGYEG